MTQTELRSAQPSRLGTAEGLPAPIKTVHAEFVTALTIAST